MAEAEVIGRYMPGWSLKDTMDMAVRVRRYWAQTAVYRLRSK